MPRPTDAEVEAVAKALSVASYGSPAYWGSTVNHAYAAIAAIDQSRRQHRAAVPEGWKLVPVKPTEEMEVAGSAAETVHVECVAYADAAIIYRAMLAAAPPPPAPSQEPRHDG